MTAPLSPLAGAARAYAARGLHVFQLAPRGKVPATRHGFKDASADLEQVAAWWRRNARCNIGIACGASGLLVVDLDGGEALATWADLAARNASSGRSHDRTLVADTGKGLHVWFAAAGAVWARSTTGRIAPGIDTRGAGGYVVAPPSVHPSGRVYRWRDPGAPIAPAPGWLAELLQPATPPPIGERAFLPIGVDATAYGRVALEGMAREVCTAPVGRRHATLNAKSWRAGRLGAGGELAATEAERLLVDAALVTGEFDLKEATRVFRDGFNAGLAAGPVARRARA